MTEFKSGIVLYPEGEVGPAAVRQLGLVTNAVEKDGKVVHGAAHAVPYDPQLVTEGIDPYYHEWFKGKRKFFPPSDEKSKKQIDAQREELLAIAKSYLRDNGFSEPDDEYATYRRRFDLIAPAGTPEDGHGISLFGYSINYISGTGASSFAQTAHPWTQERGTFKTAHHSLSSMSSIALGDFRKELLGTATLKNRTIIPTATTLGSFAMESLGFSAYDNGERSIDLPYAPNGGVRLIEGSSTHHGVYKIAYDLKVDQAVEKQLEEKVKELNEIDNQNWKQYTQEYDLEGGSDMFGDYRPKPVSREPLSIIAAAIDPLDDAEWKRRLT